MAKRVREAAGRLHFNATALGEKLGLPSSTAANYWSGKRPWPVEVVPDLAAALATNVEYLMMGAEAGGERLADRQLGWHGPPPERAGDEVAVAEIDLRYGLGGTFLDSPVEAAMRRFSRAWLRNFTDTPPEELAWASGQGDSMYPTIHDQDFVLIDRGDAAPTMADRIWVFAFGEIGMIKRLRPMPDGSVKILSDNPQVPPETAHDGELHIIGRVAAIVRRV